MIYREVSGPSETHAQGTDFNVVQIRLGDAPGRRQVDRLPSGLPDEMRGTGVEGTRRVERRPGEVVNIAPGAAHEIVVAPGKPVSSLTVKVKKAR